jgi:hypothetical protein
VQKLRERIFFGPAAKATVEMRNNRKPKKNKAFAEKIIGELEDCLTSTH